MKRYGEGLGLEIVKGVNKGLIKEPITFEKVKQFCEQHGLNPTDNQMRVTLSNATENEHSPTYTKYFERTGRGRYIVRNEYRSLVGYYWLNVDPEVYEWSFTHMEIGDTQTYSNTKETGGKRIKESCFRSIKIGDLAVAYETARTKAITAICKVIDKYIEEDIIYIQFAKQRHFTQHLTIEKMKELEALAESKIISSHRGTLLDISRRDFRTITSALEKINSTTNYFDNLEKEVSDSRKDSSDQRRQRLINRKQVEPEKMECTVTIFKRNPDVIAEVLERANGFCENCGNPAPFRRAMDNQPYLEIHHHFRLADGGEDTVENAMAVCPNCHRQLHYG